MENLKPKVVYKYRDWEDEHHKDILLRNEIYLASSKDFNDPFDCRITQNFSLLSVAEREEYIKLAGISLFLENQHNPPTNLPELLLNLDKRFEDIEKFQAEYDSLHDKLQNDHFGIFSCSSTWRSILMWSHYSRNHEGFCVGFYNDKLIRDFGKIGKVQYKHQYPEIKPKITRYDPDFMYQSFTRSHTKSFPWRYEHEYRLMLTLYPEQFTKTNRKKIIDNECIAEVILGINSTPETRKEISDICRSKEIPVYLAKKNPYSFSMTRELIPKYRCN